MHSDPLELFREAVSALNREDWLSVARLCDPVSLRAFKHHLLAALAPSVGKIPRLTATELMKAVPGMPRAVAEYQVGRFRESMDPKQRLRDEVPSVKSRQDLDSMAPDQVFAAWLEGRSPRRQIERNVERRRISRATANEVIADGLDQFKLQALGFVADGPRIGHIIYRREDASRAASPASPADAEPVPDGSDSDQHELVRDLRGREQTSSVVARRQPDGGWLLVAALDFPLVNQVSVASHPSDAESAVE